MTKTTDKVRYIVGDSKEETTVSRERSQKGGKVVIPFGVGSKTAMHTSEKEAIWEIKEAMQKHFYSRVVEVQITFAEVLSSTGEEV